MKKEQKEAIEEATERLSKAAQIPQENIKIYVHLFYRIKEAEENSTFLIDALKRLNKNHLKLLEEAVEFKWLTQYEASLLWHLWQYFMNKDANRDKFSIKVLTDIITRNLNGEKPKPGRRMNPALEFIFWALKEDSMEFDGGKPHYKEISQLITSLDQKWDNRYAEETLRGKRRNPIFENESLILTKAYFDAKGEHFLPAKLPDKPQGHVKHILENLGLIPMPGPRPSGIDISRLLKGMKPQKKKTSR